MQRESFLGAEVEEARACRSALQQAQGRDIQSIIVEGECQSLIAKLQQKTCLNADIGVIIQDILALSTQFSFCAFQCVRWERIRVVHALPTNRPYVLGVRFWMDDLPDDVFNFTVDDFCCNLILQ